LTFWFPFAKGQRVVGILRQKVYSDNQQNLFQQALAGYDDYKEHKK
jgi:hypothetical protein